MQHRMSSHTHGFMWIKDTPDLQVLCEKALQGFKESLKKKKGEPYDDSTLKAGLEARKTVESYAH